MTAPNPAPNPDPFTVEQVDDFGARDGDLHLMVDIETLGTTVPSPITEAGFYPFKLVIDETDNTKTKVLLDKVNPFFLLHPSVSYQLSHGAEIEPDTLAWWLRQSDAARTQMANALDAEGSNLNEVHDWLKTLGVQEEGGCRLWAKPASFDIPHLEWLWRAYGMPFPIHHRNKFCLRTYCMDHKVPKGRRDKWKVHYDLIPHRAEDDCFLQILEMAYAWHMKASN